MSVAEQVLLQKIRQLPPQRLADVEDFVDILTHALGRSAPHASCRQGGGSTFCGGVGQ